jgi:hypothetical protein
MQSVKGTAEAVKEGVVQGAQRVAAFIGGGGEPDQVWCASHHHSREDVLHCQTPNLNLYLYPPPLLHNQATDSASASRSGSEQEGHPASGSQDAGPLRSMKHSAVQALEGVKMRLHLGSPSNNASGSGMTASGDADTSSGAPMASAQQCTGGGKKCHGCGRLSAGRLLSPLSCSWPLYRSVILQLLISVSLGVCYHSLKFPAWGCPFASTHVTPTQASPCTWPRRQKAATRPKTTQSTMLCTLLSGQSRE